MSGHDPTSMGGQREAFLTTHWSLIENVQKEADKDRALIGLLLQRYWKPVYCYLRRKGYDNEQAKDLTQGFLHEVVLNRHLVDRADSSRGRFRSLLLHALNHYVLDVRRKERARSRIPKEKLVPLDIAEAQTLPRMVCQLDAEQSFNYIWKADLMARALAQAKDTYAERGMEAHWHVFEDRFLRPILDDRTPPPLRELCDRYGIDDEPRASNMLSTAKRHVRRVLRDLICETVASSAAEAEELQEFSRFLEKDDKI